MDRRLEKLRAWGCETEQTMERFLGDEEFYFECYENALHDPGFLQLEDALGQHDIRKAFDTAHTLKGLFANLGLLSLFDILTDIVESLRDGQDEGLLDKYQDLLRERERYLQL